MKKILLILLCLPFIGFGQSLNNLSFGSADNLDVITWNLEWFPKNGQTTIDSLATAIIALDVDVIAVQEINSTTYFNDLLSQLNDYSGVYGGSNLRLGFIYKSSLSVNSIYTILTNYSHEFASRPPLLIDVTFNNENFIIINTHLKCCGDGVLDLSNSSDEETRRYNAMNLLKQYIDQNHGNDNVVVLGDFNDLLTDPSINNIFQQILDDSVNYTFADMAIANGGLANWSYPSWPSHLDHILITNELLNELNNGTIETILIDNYFSAGFAEYDATISDHRPVGISLGFLIYGCTDSLALNYDSTATIDDGSCTYQMTYVPDDNFEQALINLGYDNVLDDSVLTANINTVTNLNVNSQNIYDLTGIEDFTALSGLFCYNNQLTSLDVSNNTALSLFYCDNNQLTNLDLSQNTALSKLVCYNNQLTILDVSNNTALHMLEGWNNQLTTLDLSGATALTSLWCQNNQLDSLDVSQNTALQFLYCNYNQLDSLNVSNNTALYYLYCYSNQLTSLDVSQNTTLQILACYNNQLTSLDVSQNTDLLSLRCDNNQLTTLDVRNGNNQNISTTSYYLNLTNNPQLYCIDVDDPTWSTTNWTNIDPWASFSSNCATAFGCTDFLACNYDSLATIDDGGCSIICLYGCTDSLAINYEPLANTDDGSCCGLQLDWDQIGLDIDGEATIDASGRAISFNSAGDIVAIGARWNDGAGIDAGHVRIYQYNGSAWGQLGQDIDGENANDFSGHSLAINGAGDRVAIGAYGNDDNGTNSGHVRVYEYNGSAWIQLGQDIDGELANDFKGFKVDINEMGDRIVVGSYGNDDNGTNAGKTQVYHFDGVAWNQVGSNIYGSNPNDAIGKALQINDSGNIIAIGSSSNSDNGTNSGQVRVFELLNTDWVQMGQNLNGESNGDFSGAAISLNNFGNIIAIGAKRNDGNGSNAGHVRVFQYSANVWTQIGQDIDGESVGDESGYSLSLNGLGNRIAIGSYLNSDNAAESGHVRVFYFDATSWNQIGNDIYGEFANDWSGRSVALNNIGDKLAIGADLNDGNGAHSGHVRVFSYNTSCLEGCMDIAATNYDSTAIIDDGSCFIYGCTGPTSCNYNPNATIDDGSCYGAMGCTDVTACNYNASVCIDDGSCEYTSCVIDYCLGQSITGLFISDIIDDRVTANFDNLNIYDANGTQQCRVDQLRIKYREVGTSSWSQKNIASPTGYDTITGICNSTQKTDKNIYNLTPATTYQWQMRLWYCETGATVWVNGPNFTTLGECPNVGNFTAYGVNPNKATFDWDDSNGFYEFVRIKLRVDSISNAQGLDWVNAGGTGVAYPTFTKNKSGLVAGETYRAQARTWCDPNGGAYNSLGWTPLVSWTQPTSNRLEGGESISNLDVYPNPSRDVFNITFTSEQVQNLKVKVLNVVGEILIDEDLQQFIGEYIKQIDLTNNAKGIYFLEIETSDGMINKRLALQ